MVRLVEPDASDQDSPSLDDEFDGRVAFRDRGRPYRVLVVGDWGVEERWLTSAAPGGAAPRTLQALSGRGDATLHLDAAGATALRLHGVSSAVDTDDEAPLCEILGLGIWSPFDTHILKALFDPLYAQAKTPHRLQRPDPGAPHNAVARVRLFDLARALPEQVATSTHRRVRRFERRGDAVVERDAVVWETPAPRDASGRASWIHPDFEWAALDEALDTEQDVFGVDAVVVADAGRGVVAAPLLHFVKQKCPFAEWFVETPDREADWLGELADVALRLLVIRPGAGTGAADVIGPWLAAGGEPSRDAVAALRDWLARFPETAPMSVVVLPEAGVALAAERTPRESAAGDLLVCAELSEASSLPIAGQAGLFAGLVANQLRHPGAPINLLLPLALSDAPRFDAFAHDQLMGVGSPLLRPQIGLAGVAPERISPVRSRVWELADATRSWWEATRGEGVIATDSGAGQLQLRRASESLTGYVAWEPGKRRAIGRLVAELGRWARDASAPSAAGLIVGPPGSGRGSLARRLAERFGLRLLSFPTAQLASRADVIDVLDAITTASLERRAPALLVHVDEVDARVGGEVVFELFGSALERGAYSREGRVFPLARSAWLFTASGALLASEAAPHWRNFVAGLSLPSVDLAPGSDPTERALENVYLGARLLRDAHPAVRFAERGVLELFRHLPLDVSARELRAFTGRFAARDDRVSLASIAAGERIGKQSVDELLASLLTTPDEEWVELVW